MGVRSRRAILLLVVLSYANVLIGQVSAPAPPSQRIASAAIKVPANRIIVKLRPQLAAQAEAALPAKQMTIAIGAAPGSPLQIFMTRYGARQMRPVYPAMLRMKQQQHGNDAQITEAVRTRFATRANRFHGTFQPPELSRTYVIELDAEASVTQVLARLRLDPNVEYAEEDRRVSVNLSERSVLQQFQHVGPAIRRSVGH